MLDILIHSKRNEKLQQETEGVRTPPIGIDNPSLLAASAPARAFLASASAKSRRPPRRGRWHTSSIPPLVTPEEATAIAAIAAVVAVDGGLYFAKTDSDKSENQYRNLLNRTLPNQESAKPESAKTHSGIC